MKKILFALALLINISAFGQFQKTETVVHVPVGSVKWMGAKFSELSYYTVGVDTFYTITYKNQVYRTLNSWEVLSFSGGSAVLVNVYDALILAANADKGAESSFKLGDASVTLSTRKTAGRKFVAVIISTPGKVLGLTELTEGQIKSLFGKAE